MKEKRLTARQEALYELLVVVAKADKDRWLTQKQIVEEVNQRLKEGKRKYVYRETPNRHNYCPAIWDDAEAINNTMFKDKIIVMDDCRFKIASNYEEANLYIESLCVRLARLSKRISVLRQKVRRSNQGKIVSNAGTPMNSRCKPFHETFIDYIDDDKI